MTHLRDKVGSMEGALNENKEKTSQILATLEAQKKQSSATAIGQRGEDWVLEELRGAIQ